MKPPRLRHLEWASRFVARHPWIAERARANATARALQPLFDARERWVLPTLHASASFPYRIAQPVEGRVLLGCGTLDGGGAERQIVNTVEGLRARGADDVHLLVEYLDEGTSNAFYLQRARRAAASIVRPGELEDLPEWWMCQHPKFRRVASEWLFSQILRDADTIQRLSPQVVQCSLDWPNITIGMAAVLAGVPRVFLSGRNLGPRYFAFFQWFMYPCYRALAAHPSVRLLNNSDAGRNDYARWLGLSQHQIRVVRNGLHPAEFAPPGAGARSKARAALGLTAAAPVIAGVFRLSPEKRPLLWLQAAARIKAQMKDAVFLHCGIGRMQAQVEAHAQRLGLKDSLCLLGAREDIQTAFAAADVVLHTSAQEGTPNALIEAQAMGVPVVATPAYGAKEAVQDGVTGVIVRKETAMALARAVLSVMGDPGMRMRARRAGPAFVAARFGFERMIDETLEAYADAGVAWAAGLVRDGTCDDPITRTVAS